MRSLDLRTRSAAKGMTIKKDTVCRASDDIKNDAPHTAKDDVFYEKIREAP